MTTSVRSCAMLADGAAVVLLNELKVKDSSITLKIGAKVKRIRLVASGTHPLAVDRFARHTFSVVRKENGDPQVAVSSGKS